MACGELTTSSPLEIILKELPYGFILTQTVNFSFPICGRSFDIQISITIVAAMAYAIIHSSANFLSNVVDIIIR